MMRRLLLIIFCGLLLISCSRSDTTFHDTHHEQFNAAQLKGKWLIINYWAAWCDSCVKEIPQLNRFYQNNKDKNILIFGVNYDHLQAKNLIDAVNKVNIKFPVLLEDPAAAFSLDDISVLPVTFIVDPNGNRVKKIIGPSTEKSLLAALAELQKI